MSEIRCDSPQCEALQTLTPQSHYDRVRDASTREPVNRVTPLATLYTFGEDHEQDQYLRDLTGIVRPAVRCGVKTLTSNGSFPEDHEESAHGYDLYYTYSRLAFAPCVRLECRFVDREAPEMPPYHTIVLEFHFSPGVGTHLTNFETPDDYHVQFKTNGATHSGFAGVHEHRHRFRGPEEAIICFLRSLTRTTPITLYFVLTKGTDADHLFELRQCMPGGSEPQLESFGKPEYSAFRDEDGNVALSKLKNPHALMHGAMPFPMMPLDHLDSFSTQDQAVIHLIYAAYASEMEERVALELWADVYHDAVIYNLDGYDVPILAVKYNQTFKKLGNRELDAFFKLPSELPASALFESDEEYLSDLKGDEYKNQKKYRTLQLVLDDIPGLAGYHATFLVMNDGGFDWLRRTGRATSVAARGFSSGKKIKIEPQRREFTFKSFQNTCGHLMKPNHPFLEHLLNQDTGTIPDQDITRELDGSDVRQADAWLHDWAPWNTEQKEVLDTIHRAKGGMAIVKGIAGTGKTMLQTGICQYFASLGYKVLVAQPTNSNASHAVAELNEANVSGLTMFRSHAVDDYFRSGTDSRTACPVRPLPSSRRLFSAALESTVEDISEEQEQAQGPRVGGRTSSLRALEFTLRSIKDGKAGSRHHSIEHAVIAEADLCEFKLYIADGERVNPDDDAWDVFRKHLAKSREGAFDWRQQNDVEEYEEAYRYCKNQIVASTNILVTTTGNARSKDILKPWLESDRLYGIPYKGIIVMCDEAFKDTELATWNAIMAAGDRVKGVYLFGDERQLAPTNTASKGKLVYGPFNAQSDIALATRLVRQGYPFVFLKEQQRMHPCLSKFPNEEFYGGQLRDGPRVRDTLDGTGPTSQPGLSDVLHGIIRSTFDHEEDALLYDERRTDEQARHHYFEVDGERKVEDTSSWVREHIDAFFEHIFPDLQQFWKEKTFKNLIIIAPYSKARREYRARIERLQRTQQLPSGWYPDVEGSADAPSPSSSSAHLESLSLAPVRRKRNPESAYTKCHTIDSAQGQEAFMVVLDTSSQHRDCIGFMTDPGRCNVALTRARGVCWILGGELQLKHPRRRNHRLSPLPKLKDQMAEQGRVHKLRPKPVYASQQTVEEHRA